MTQDRLSSSAPAMPAFSSRHRCASTALSERIALINDEAHLPYQRPPLSKAYLKGDGRPDSLMFRPEKFYHDQKIDLIADRAVVDRPRRAQGDARLRRLARLRPPGAGDRRAQSPARHSQRQSRQTCAICGRSTKARRCGSDIAPGQRVVVIGAGFIGLEFAATARAKGLEVDVVELATRVMARAVTAEISEYFQARHTAAGIRIHLGVQVTSIESDGSKVTGVSLSDGRHMPADLIVVGVGVLPNVELAAEAGLPVAAGHHRRRAIADVRSRTSRRSATARCSQARASAARCGWSRCRTPPITRAASRRG